MPYVQRYQEMLRSKARSFAVVDGQLFIRQQGWVTPLGPAAQQFTLSTAQAREVRRKLGGWWITWTGGFQPSVVADRWYAVICRQFKGLDEMDGKRRYEVKRALKNCEVKQISADEVARDGFETFSAALRSYGEAHAAEAPSEDEFRKRVRGDSGFPDIRHHWGAYHGGRMIAFAQCNVFDQVEVNYSLIKIHPEHMRLCPGYALVHRMNEYYLAEQKFEYVNDGWRSILHETGIQEFLIQKFGFEKVSSELCLSYRPPLGLIMAMVARAPASLSQANRRLAAMTLLHQASRGD